METQGIVIPARQNSTRLYQKHLYPLNGTPLMDILWQRLQPTELPIRFAFSNHDFIYHSHASKKGFDFACGDEADVLGRLVVATEGWDHVVVVHGDSPLVGPHAVQLVAGQTARCVGPSGFRVWSLPRDLLLQMEAVSRGAREHPTCLFGFHMEMKHVHLSDANVKLSVDTMEDLDRVNRLMVQLGPNATELQYIQAVNSGSDSGASIVKTNVG